MMRIKIAMCWRASCLLRDMQSRMFSVYTKLILSEVELTYLTVNASAFFLSSACPFVAPCSLPFIAARTVTVGTTTYLFVDMARPLAHFEAKAAQELGLRCL